MEQWEIDLRAKLKKELPYGKYELDGYSIDRNTAINYIIDSESKKIPIKVQYAR